MISNAAGHRHQMTCWIIPRSSCKSVHGGHNHVADLKSVFGALFGVFKTVGIVLLAAIAIAYGVRICLPSA